jgi:hypothetical protein
MNAPKCRICGGQHWGSCQGDRGAPLVRRSATVTPQPVTKRDSVTERDVTERDSRLAGLIAENEALRAEVARLKEQQRQVHSGSKAPMTAAERQRRLRQRRKEAAGLSW